MSCKSGSAFPTTFEFAVWKQDCLPLVRAVVLTLVEESINLVYPQVPLFPHIEDYLWPDFSDDADAFFEQFEEEEELASYRSASPLTCTLINACGVRKNKYFLLI